MVAGTTAAVLVSPVMSGLAKQRGGEVQVVDPVVTGNTRD